MVAQYRLLKTNSARAAAGLCRWAGQHDDSNTNSLSHTCRGPSGFSHMAMGAHIHCSAEAAPPKGQSPSRKHDGPVETQPPPLHATVGEGSRWHFLNPSSDSTGMLASCTTILSVMYLHVSAPNSAWERPLFHGHAKPSCGCQMNRKFLQITGVAA